MAQVTDLQPQTALHDDDSNKRTVVLESTFNEAQSALLVARFSRRYVWLDNLTTESDGEDDEERTPRVYQLSADAMRALCAAWQQYEADQQEKERKAEEAHKAELTELRTRVEALGGTMTGPLDGYGGGYGDYFNVVLTGRWAHCSDGSISTSRVKRLIEDIDRTLAHEVKHNQQTAAKAAQSDDAEAQAERALEERAADFNNERATLTIGIQPPDHF